MIRESLFMIRAYAMICATLGLDSLRVAMTGGIPMPLETHGTAIYEIPAELWSGISFAQGVMVLIFAGTRWNWTLALVALCGGVINIALGVYSASAEFGFVQTRVALGAGLLHLVICALAIHDARRCHIIRRLQVIEARIVLRAAAERK